MSQNNEMSAYEQQHEFPTMWHLDKCRLGRVLLLSLETQNDVQSVA